MNNSLYDISSNYIDALNNVQLDEQTGEIIGIEAVEAVHAAFENKAEAVALYIKNCAALHQSLKDEETALSSRRKTIERQIECLKAYLTTCCKTVDCHKLETAKCKISFRKSESVEIKDTSLLPTEYIKTKIELLPDKTAIKSALKDGKQVTGATLVQSDNIQIK